MVLSTMRVHDDLVASGMPEEQARAVVRIIEQQHAALASKSDLDLLAARIETLIWRGVGFTCTVVVAVGGAVIGVVAALS